MLIDLTRSIFLKSTDQTATTWASLSSGRNKRVSLTIIEPGRPYNILRTFNQSVNGARSGLLRAAKNQKNNE